ncbi:cobalamin B12-binding domain-containing protein [Falsiroseomonas selenitidurans]|uniref:Cobalamin B12-binding domain-containing protein n=1 Tax=Falsiroseomonas selenitidurans TaxID=2716335 RepID=A0ABX1E9E2_9PROT|nr:cobalamin B12-binding domain-containing protein [Falsiroseomonas selenitidurans]NKC33819.1 cobalamin B12-binding domain-containing protein [Falsiroseomonas selenitidurans]
MAERAGQTQEAGSGHGVPQDGSQQEAAGRHLDLEGATRRLQRGPPPSRGERRRVAVLARTLETEVIPRLVLSRQAPNTPAYIDSPTGSAPQAEDVSVLAGLAMRGDLAGALGYVGALTARGMRLDVIYLSLLAPVARRLGEMWEEDRCDFTAVTIGLCCLQQVVLENSPAFQPRHGRTQPDRRVLLAPAPGEQHSFGLLMVGEFFRRQGWEVSSGTGASIKELAALVRRQWFAAIGFSLASEDRLEILAAAIREIRRASRNPRIGVLVGGRAFQARPELAALVGADATAADGQQAALKAETLLALLMREA